MKKMKGFLTALLAAVIVTAGLGTADVQARSERKPTSVKITSAVKNVTVGSTFELKAKTVPLNAEDDYLYWSITGTKGIIAFDDDDRYDDEMEFRALKAGTTTVKCKIAGTSKYATVTVNVKKGTPKISRVGKATKTVEVGDDFELEVKKSGGVKDNDLKWSIKNTKILRFDDRDITDDEVELVAKRTGTTTVTCTNTKTGKKITYTVKVVQNSGYDDYDDDDDDYDDD